MKNVLDEKILEEANLWIKANHKVVLTTVIRTWGSSPRQVGSKMIVNEKGNFSGSISGGCVESLVIDESLKYSQHIGEGISYYSYKSNDPEMEIVFTNKWKLTITNEGEQFVFYCPPSNNNTYAGLIPGEWYSEQADIKAIVNFTALPYLKVDPEEYYNNEYN